MATLETRPADPRVIIITGGAQGIGAAFARSLSQGGARVVIADLDEARAESLAAELREDGREALAVTTDVSDRAQFERLIRLAVERFGGIDVLFNNAGMNKPVPFFEIDTENFEAIMRVNALSVLIGMQVAGEQMIRQGRGGKIINTASIAGRQGYPEFAPYCASKAAVISLTQAGARELAKHNITVNGFAPGVVKTPLWDKLEADMIGKGVIKQKGEFMDSFSSGILMGRPAMPDDLVGMAAFLASGASDYMTGQILMFDGGMVLV
ncbi:glucose 1-dehydrogenase [Lichenicola cladoniae]|uniref:Glucose 1-dehydrogenase n=1 Tax=Lichenicola cladoniae TaxID=1484109 RepID=A0A6M8HLX5_9PROT|nr:glucose 1-dehydrogenase [Lichenicola cladoniae]NPD69910.1 glucose 1-dehydrogenase [Acetobacteraceae bacterium]QKE89331.1 glucose 1-dehydrogenase [Lichenicola cladoniae]